MRFSENIQKIKQISKGDMIYPFWLIFWKSSKLVKNIVKQPIPPCKIEVKNKIFPSAFSFSQKPKYFLFHQNRPIFLPYYSIFLISSKFLALRKSRLTIYPKLPTYCQIIESLKHSAFGRKFKLRNNRFFWNIQIFIVLSNDVKFNA